MSASRKTLYRQLSNVSKTMLSGLIGLTGCIIDNPTCALIINGIGYIVNLITELCQSEVVSSSWILYPVSRTASRILSGVLSEKSSMIWAVIFVLSDDCSTSLGSVLIFN